MRFRMESGTRQRMLRRLLRLGISGAARSSSQDPTVVGELETEVALLREENAWLKVERHRPPDAGRIVERMRELGQAANLQLGEGDGAQTNEAAQTLIESLATREGLLEACQEIKRAMQGIRCRLSELSVDGEGGAEDRAMTGPVATPSTGELELELAAGAAAPELSQRAA
jgi:hypothetical protein